MTLEDWIKKYEAKTEPFFIPEGFSCWFEPDKGFFLWKKTGEAFEVDACCTNDIKFLLKRMNAMARRINCKILITQTLHNPKAFARLMKAQVNLSLSGIRDNGRMYWVFMKGVV